MKKWILLISSFWGLMAWGAQAEVMPEIQLSGKGVVSANLNLPLSQASSVVSDFSDTTLMLGLRQKLYSDWRSQMVMGVQLPDADSGLGNLFLNQTFLQLDNQQQRVKLGRSNASTSLLEFPTLRDDDALAFNYVLNPFSGGKNTQDHQYANVLEYRYVFAQRWWLSANGENYVDFQNPDQFALNAVSAAFEYRVPESQVWNREWLQYAGLRFYNFLTPQGSSWNPLTTSLKELAAGLRVNLWPDPVHFVDLRGQAIYNLGFSELQRIQSYSDYTRANALATFWSLRYLYRPLERPFLQASIGGGLRLFPHNQVQSSEWMVLANCFYRLGENLDLGLQYRYLSRQGDPSSILRAGEQSLQVALVYSFENHFFNQFDDRNSLLNLEHSYLK